MDPALEYGWHKCPPPPRTYDSIKPSINEGIVKINDYLAFKATASTAEDNKNSAMDKYDAKNTIE